MPRFFNRIRKQLANENKFFQYSRYAIGEILLVVIGILIALWVNDWNEDRKQQVKRVALIKALSVEFNANLHQLDSVMFYNDRVIEATLKIVKLEPDQDSILPTDTLQDWLKDSGYLWTFNPQNGALRSGISSGDVHLIENDSLIGLLFSWQDVTADAHENEMRHIDVALSSGNIVAPHVRPINYHRISFPGLPKSDFTSDYQSLLQDPLFEDYITELNIFTIDAKKELIQVRKQNVKILQLLNQQLNNL